ncbi:MAG TPA: hypothetical protein DEQ09_07575 [Bacteroidales bacterium]|nr:hypothetical protein [Bacteroidales bacterium]
MKRKIRLIALTALLVFAGTLVSKAQYGRFAVNQYRQQPLGYCLDIPGLDDQQKERILAVNEAHRKKLDELRLKRQTAATFEEMNEIGAAMLLQHNEHIKQVKALLTAEQKEYLNNTYFGMGPRGLRQVPAYGRGAGRGYRNFAPGRGYGRGRGRAAYGGRGLGPGGAGYGLGYGRGYRYDQD